MAVSCDLLGVDPPELQFPCKRPPLASTSPNHVPISRLGISAIFLVNFSADSISISFYPQLCSANRSPASCGLPTGPAVPSPLRWFASWLHHRTRKFRCDFWFTFYLVSHASLVVLVICVGSRSRRRAPGSIACVPTMASCRRAPSAQS